MNGNGMYATPQFNPMATKWDPKQLEIKTYSVEEALEPLVMQVTTLVNTKGPSNKKKGQSKRAHVLVAAVEKATEHFILMGEQIANENPDYHTELMAAVDEVRLTGGPMSQAAREFAEDPMFIGQERKYGQSGEKLTFSCYQTSDSGWFRWRW